MHLQFSGYHNKSCIFDGKSMHAVCTAHTAHCAIVLHPVLPVNFDSLMHKSKERISLEALCSCNFHFAAPGGSIWSSQVDTWASCQSKGCYSCSVLTEKSPLGVPGPRSSPPGQAQRRKGGPKSHCQHSWAARITQTASVKPLCRIQELWEMKDLENARQGGNLPG